MLDFRPGNEADIPVIQQIVEESWPLAYGHILSAEQIRYMLDAFYSTSSLTAQMHTNRFLLATIAGEVIGFASYELKEDPGVYKLHKLYLLPGLKGSGFGKQLLEKVMQNISDSGAKSLFLNVNRHNSAIGFYERLGFSIIRQEDIDIGNGYWMNDYVMQKSLQ